MLRPCCLFDVFVAVAAVLWLLAGYCARLYARDNGSAVEVVVSGCLSRREAADCPLAAESRPRSVSGRRDLCDILIKLRIDFYQPSARSPFQSATVLRSYQQQQAEEGEGDVPLSQMI